MVDQYVNDFKADSEEVMSSNVTLSPSRIDILKHLDLDGKVKHTISNKLINETSDSGYGNVNNFDSKAESNSVSGLNLNSDSEFLIDENARVSFPFGSNNKLNKSTVDMETSAISFSMENFGEKKLNKLKTKSGVLKQLSERREECLENLLRGSIDITSESDLDFSDNSRTAQIVQHINPEQAINSAELLHIIKHDQLATDTDIENVDQSKESELEK